MVGFAKRWVLAAVLVLAVGVPWPTLQTLAWLKMIADYSRGTTLVEALSMTFDGKHPCRLCHLIQQGQAKERQPQRDQTFDEKLQLGLPPEPVRLPDPPLGSLLLLASTPPACWSQPPATPPPRAT
jgi:hypothetical protein